VGLDDLENALKLNLICYSKNLTAGSAKTSLSEGYARNTAFFLFDFLGQHRRYDHLFRIIHGLCDPASPKLDPIEEPLLRTFDLLPRHRGTRAEIQRIRGRLDHTKKELEARSQWFDQSARDRVVKSIATAVGIISRQVKEAK